GHLNACTKVIAAWSEWLNLTIVNEAKIDNVHRDFRIVTRTELIPHFLLDLFQRCRRATIRGGFCHLLHPKRIGVPAFDTKHIAVDDDSIASAERLCDKRLFPLLKCDSRADRNDRRTNVAHEEDWMRFCDTKT